MAINALPVRGTKDFLPKEAEIRDYVQNIILSTYKEFGFNRIQTPIMEDIERLDKSDGGENLSLIFKLIKRGQKLDLSKENLTEKDLVDSGLRFDLTMPLSRYYANNRAELPNPFKTIQVDKVFRAERPQKGRLREFYQCDIDILGDKSINAEMDLINVTATTLKRIGFNDFVIKINDRRILAQRILDAGFGEEDISLVCIIFDKQDKIGIDGVEKELLENGFEEAKVKAFLNADTTASDEIKQIIETLPEANLVYDPSLVRGMGYYTGIIFEIHSEEFSSALGGGGRYDKMVGKFLGQDVPAVGFSIGFERICAILLDKDYKIEGTKKLVLVYDDNQNFADVLKEQKELISQGYVVNLLKRSKKLGKQIDELVNLGYKFLSQNGEMKNIG
ncbi:MAG: histidine--tRNA ligase [Alphaproteobacteria bacterium]